MSETASLQEPRGERRTLPLSVQPFLRGGKKLVEVTWLLLVSQAGPGQWQPGWLPLLGSLWLPGTELHLASRFVDAEGSAGCSEPR